MERTFFQGLIILDLRYTIYELRELTRVHRMSEIANSKTLFLGRPTLAHQTDEMLQGLVVAAALLGGELVGALVELRGHLGGFLRRTAEGDEDLGELREFHK